MFVFCFVLLHVVSKGAHTAGLLVALCIISRVNRTKVFLSCQIADVFLFFTNNLMHGISKYIRFSKLLSLFRDIIHLW